MLVTRRYTFKLYPTAKQRAVLEEQSALLAQLWNAALEQREIQWAHECQRKPKGERKGLSRFDQQKELKLIRREDPRFAAMSSASLELTIAALDLAFQAFFSRAKQGAGKSSGYPQYKSTSRHRTIPHRDGKGWKLHHLYGKNWRIYAKGIPGRIRARGKFPAEPKEIRTMQLMERDGAWWASIVVKMEARLVHGRAPVEVDFDLVDRFATVKNRANGECLSGLSDFFGDREGEFSNNRRGLDQHRADASSICGEATGDLFACDLFREAEASSVCGEATGARSAKSSSAGAEASAICGEATGVPHYIPGDETADASSVCGEATGLKSSSFSSRMADAYVADAIQSNRDRRYQKFSCRWRREKARIAKLKAKQARQRREALHLWATQIIRAASDVLVIAPEIKQSTKSARGDERNPGAAVEPVAMLNRHILSQAPASAIQMLEYKAAEAGIQFARITPAEHAVNIGRELPKATKLARKARRILRKEAA